MAELITYEYLDAETINSIMDLMDGDVEMVLDLVDTLLESNPDLLSEIKLGIDNNDSPQIREAAHALKSSNAQLGALEFAKICLAMETAGKQGDLPQAREILPQLEQEYQRVLAALTSWHKELAASM